MIYKIILPGVAGLVRQYLLLKFKAKGYNNIFVLDKHIRNLAVLKKPNPNNIAEYADLAEFGD